MAQKPEPVEMLICFVDIGGWLRATEQKSRDEVFEFLTRFYEQVVPLAEEHGGRVVKLMGDAALIVWQPEEAASAIEGARVMLAEFDALVADFSLSEPLNLHVAMASGPVIAAEMGPPSIRRFDVIGDAVNNAALMLRYCDFTITQAVADAAGDTDLSGIDIVES